MVKNIYISSNRVRNRGWKILYLLPLLLAVILFQTVFICPSMPPLWNPSISPVKSLPNLA